MHSFSGSFCVLAPDLLNILYQKEKREREERDRKDGKNKMCWESKHYFGMWHKVGMATEEA